MKKITRLAMLAVLLVPCLAFAAPKVVLDIKAEIEVTVEENGKMITKRMPATEVEPGKEIFYTLNYKNEGDATAANVEVKNKIPDSSVYVLDSAWGQGADITFSIDSGKSFKSPSMLVYEVKDVDGKTMKKKVTPEKYTDILWVVKEIPAGKSGMVGFRVRVN